MSVKKFKFVSPGVFINEIDNSFIPRRPDTIGPTVIGRATSGLGMQPVKVDAFSSFVSMFGDTVPGAAGGDVYRNGLRTQSPIYGTYGAKAFLNAGVAPLTYVRALGHQHANADTEDGTSLLASPQAGWRTENQLNAANGGGTFGLFLMPSGALNHTGAIDTSATANTASLAAIWYLESGMMMLSGNAIGSGSAANRKNYKAIGTVIESDTSGVFKAVWRNGDDGAERVYDFSLDDNNENFVRRVFNTNPQLTVSGNFYPTSAETSYFLGETYEQEIRDMMSGTVASSMFGVIVPLHLSSSGENLTIHPGNRMGSNAQAREAVAGWFISQDTGPAADYNVVSKTTKLFRLIGRGHGAWLNENVKISISNIRYSNNSTTDYGTFSVLVRSISDSDGAQQVLERFDNCNLDPSSPDYIGRKIGDQYHEWNEAERRLKYYGEYPNQSKYVYVDVAPDVAAGASGMETLLPFGYYGPPKYKDVNVLIHSKRFCANGATGGQYAGGFSNPDNCFLLIRTGSTESGISTAGGKLVLSGGITPDRLPAAAAGPTTSLPIQLTYPAVRLRNSASDGGQGDPRGAFFGFSPTRTSGSNRFDPSTPGVQAMLSNQFANKADPTATTVAGIDSFAYVFTLDDLVDSTGGTTNPTMFYRSGSRRAGAAGDGVASYTGLSGKDYKSLIDAGYNNFTAPMWGGFDGFNIKLPDPLYNGSMSSAATEKNSSAYYTIKRAIDTVADPEVVETNLITMPGLTQTSLTSHIISVCEERADALGIIDLPDVYLPTHEGQYSGRSSKASRIATTPTGSARDLRDRRLDSSYGATFYPWVQTRDETTGAAVWLPPSAAMLGVLASSEKKAQLWFAPAGFNRGGLTEGAAGIPISGVTEKLTSKQRDLLYEASINPIASFPSTGIVVFGQKTLQERQSALDRINVRRLVIFLKKEISRISTKILFEQNVQTTWNRFTGLVEPFLANVKSNFGISDYKLILDESTTTPDLVDQNILYAKIMVKPARAIEYIAIDFVVASTGASFDD